MGGAFGVVVLAARELPGATLLHAARTALDSGATEVVVVVGSESARRGLRGLPVRAIVAGGGLGDSVAAGVAALSPRVESAVVTLANRVRVTPGHLRALAYALAPHPCPSPPEGRGRRTVVASAYEGTVGAPAAFARSEFARLVALTGSEGARGLLQGAATIALVGANVRAIRPVSTPLPPLGVALGFAAPRFRACRAPPLAG